MKELIFILKQICEQQKHTLSHFFNLVEVLYAKGVLSDEDVDYIREHNAFEESKK